METNLNDMDAPFCDICGESPVTISFAEIGTCDPCGEAEFQRQLTPLMGYKPCCTVITQSSGQKALCLAVAGTEHDH